MGEFFWTIFGIILQIFGYLSLVAVGIFFISFLRAMATNPKTCRFEHKVTGKPLHPWEKPVKTPTKQPKAEWDWDALGLPENKPIALEDLPKKQRPEWVRFLFEENLGTLMEKRKQRKLAEQKERENGSRR